jgi:hypothetical protein
VRWLIEGLGFCVCVAVILLYTSVGYEPEPVRSTRPDNPLATIVRDATDAQPREGRVEALLDAGSYTYLELRGESSTPFWVVTMGRAPPAGSRVRVRSFGHRRDFYSARLQRTFPELVFGIVSRID